MELLLKLLHIGFVSLWLAGALYLPRLYRAHAEAGGRTGDDALLLERRIFFHWMTPAALLAVLLGTILLFFGFEGGWLPVKLALLVPLVLFHLFCGRVLLLLEKHQPTHGPLFWDLSLLIPMVLLLPIITLAVAKPF